MSERRISKGIVYRAGKGNPSNMTPRPSDTEGPQRGLSAHVDPTRALPHIDGSGKPRIFRVALIDVGELRDLQAFEDDTGHVAIRPTEDSVLKEWAESRNAEGAPHALTREVQGAIIGYVDIER